MKFIFKIVITGCVSQALHLCYIVKMTKHFLKKGLDNNSMLCLGAYIYKLLTPNTLQ